MRTRRCFIVTFTVLAHSHRKGRGAPFLSRFPCSQAPSQLTAPEKLAMPFFPLLSVGRDFQKGNIITDQEPLLDTEPAKWEGRFKVLERTAGGEKLTEPEIDSMCRVV